MKMSKFGEQAIVNSLITGPPYSVPPAHVTAVTHHSYLAWETLNLLSLFLEGLSPSLGSTQRGLRMPLRH